MTTTQILYRREAQAGWTADVQSWDTLASLSGRRDPNAYRWTTVYDEEMDCWYATTPEGQTATYYRVGKVG